MPFNIKSLENLLEKTELDPENLAKVIGVSRSTVYRWLRGEISPRVENIDAVYSLSKQRGLRLTFYEEPK